MPDCPLAATPCCSPAAWCWLTGRCHDRQNRLGGGMDMADAPVRWPDEVDEVIRGDLTAAAACVTPAGGAVVTGVCPMGLGRREAAEVGFTTSLGFGKKLERIIAD